jgi:hypothetical protein
LLEFFVLEVTARSAAEVLGIQPNTSVLFYRKLRQVIVQHLPQGSDAARLSAASLNRIEFALNHRPRVILTGPQSDPYGADKRLEDYPEGVPPEVAALAEVNTCTSIYASAESKNTTSRSTNEDRWTAATQILTATVPPNTAFGKKFRVTFADGGSEEYKKVVSGIKFEAVSGSLRLGKEGQTCSGQG